MFGVLGSLEPKIYYAAKLPNVGPRSFQRFTVPFTPTYLLVYATERIELNDNTQRFGWVLAAKCNYAATNPFYPIKTFVSSGSSALESMPLFLMKENTPGSPFVISDELVDTLFVYNQNT